MSEHNYVKVIYSISSNFTLVRQNITDKKPLDSVSVLEYRSQVVEFSTSSTLAVILNTAAVIHEYSCIS